jgi:hypothetical protein
MTTAYVIQQSQSSCHLTQTYAAETALLDKPSPPVKCSSSPLTRQANAKNNKETALPPQQQ